MGERNQTALIWAVDYEMGYALGIQAGEWASRHIPSGQSLKLGQLSYRFIPQVKHREEGILDGIRTRFASEIEVIETETAGDPLQGLHVAEQWLKIHPELDMILGINDGGALGAYQAACSIGKNDPETFFIGGIDATDEALAAIKAKGVYQATVDIQPKTTGILAVQTLVRAICERPYQPIYTLQPVPVDRSTVDQFLDRDKQVIALLRTMGSDDIPSDRNLSNIRIGLSVLSLINPFFARLIEGAQAEAERLGVELVINDPKQVVGVLVVQSDVADRLVF
jgi:ABC-type sugar transport system substrate-binding protein